ncbi:hypothetical protein RclHR1_00040012 [Rhizophagus clarus]|uniref:Uncharacterized protein n=1 Tax=Rhizophagus clarus TaxID=94130 RepID=A0A2Z6RG09_9GLOM|nr:hypothetical protein RclHR1_00040012 [Rhizophagus clarus]
MLSGTHVTKSKTSQKRKNDMLKGQRHQHLHNGRAKAGKELGQRNSNCWKRWRFHNNPNIHSRDRFHKNDVTNWVRMLVSMTAFVRLVGLPSFH